MRVRRRTLALALPVALILGLGGCTSDDEPEPGASATTTTAPTAPASETTEPTESPEPEPTATGPTPPPRPVAMDATGKKGARAAAEYFIALVTYAYATGDVSQLEEMAYPSTCTACSSIIKEAAKVETDGYSSTWGETKLWDFEVSDKDSLTGGFAVTMAFSEPAGELRDASGKILDEWEYDDGWMQFDAMHDGTRWRALAIVTDQDAAE
ncbi:hypothetical protein SAMN04489860_0607 [Paraoerskovia marina]|uniref:DUF6318 domain-containing protein n=1 Tax=Paraoerskovia marina TaxID=545619 RepID=A0A1H1NSB2_9CELL|nr:DUF6318 family protein [Paraoerskovia marina]SDS01813.1 hypothetical protein SAMN04489860_0607 [Paraoerskovia marina]